MARRSEHDHNRRARQGVRAFRFIRYPVSSRTQPEHFLNNWSGSGHIARASRTARLGPCAAFLTRRRSAILMLALLALLAASVVVEAQFRRRGGGGGGFPRGFGVRVAKPEDFVGGFQFCRVAYNSDFRGDGGELERRLPARRHQPLDSLVRADARHTSACDPAGEPIPLLIRLTDDVMFECPFIMMTEVGSAAIRRRGGGRACALYLQKGGFLWADDFWGTTRGIGGWRSSARCCHHRSIRSSTCRRTTRCSRRSSRSRRCRRSPRSATGPAPAAEPSERCEDSADVRRPRRPRQARQHHGADDAQHRPRRLIRARGRRPAVFLRRCQFPATRSASTRCRTRSTH